MCMSFTGIMCMSFTSVILASVLAVYSGNVPVRHAYRRLRPGGNFWSFVLWPDALPVTNQIMNIWESVRSSDTCVFISLAQGPVTHG